MPDFILVVIGVVLGVGIRTLFELRTRWRRAELEKERLAAEKERSRLLSEARKRLEMLEPLHRYFEVVDFADRATNTVIGVACRECGCEFSISGDGPHETSVCPGCHDVATSFKKAEGR